MGVHLGGEKRGTGKGGARENGNKRKQPGIEMDGEAKKSPRLIAGINGEGSSDR